jgi:amino acid permease
MIQRIQTIWLTIITVLSSLLCFGTIFSLTDEAKNSFSLEFEGIYKNSPGSHDLINGTPLVAMLLILISFLSIIALLLFKKRKMQMKAVLVLIFFSLSLLGLLVYYYLYIINTYNAKPDNGIKMFLPLIIFILGLLAYSGILKDEKLIRSYDRLR